MADPESWSGGCQCGAVRYRFTEKPGGAHVCHCRMCQKAFGHFYAPLVRGPLKGFEVTRGVISLFYSSDMTGRGFCAKCGTPLTLADKGDDEIFVSIGSLDHPEEFPPRVQYGIEARVAFTNGIGHLPDRRTTEAEEPEKAAFIKTTNHQHPDHDTDIWPPQGRA